MDKSRAVAIILGRKIGTFDGWDELENNVMVLYDFRADANIDIPGGDLTVMYDAGRLEIINDDGDVEWFADMLTVLRDSAEMAA